MFSFLISLLFLSNLSLAGEFIPEASGVAQVGEALVIAGDEEPKALWVVKDGSSEKTKVSGAEWDDMEALATLNEKEFFGITSHGLTKKGKEKPERSQLIHFELGKKINAKKSWNVRTSLLDFLEKNLGSELDMKTVRSASPDDGGLNVEGMTYLNGELYLGLRSPVTKSGEAIVIVLIDPTISPSPSRVLKLRLGSRGIRGLETSGKEILVLSGSSSDASEEFGLHRLNPETRATVEWKLSGFQELLRPEGLALTRNRELVFVQDFLSQENQDVIVPLKL